MSSFCAVCDGVMPSLGSSPLSRVCCQSLSRLEEDQCGPCPTTPPRHRGDEARGGGPANRDRELITDSVSEGTTSAYRVGEHIRWRPLDDYLIVHGLRPH